MLSFHRIFTVRKLGNIYKMENNLKVQLKVEEFSEVCRTCFSKNFLAPITKVTFQKKSVGNILKNCIPELDLEDKMLPQQICSICVYHLHNFHDFKIKCIENEATFKALLRDHLIKSDGSTDLEVSSKVDLSDDELPLVMRIKNHVILPKKTKRAYKHKNCAPRQQEPKANIYKCKQCKKSFPFKYKLAMHTRVHTKEKPFKCDKCDLSFSLSSNLKRHKMIHTGERPHTCQICRKGFIQAVSLQAHTQKCHRVKSPIQFTCKICNRVFKRRAACDLHMKKHHSAAEENEDKPDSQSQSNSIKTLKLEYKCKVCEREFAKLVFLKNHETRHGEKTFLCSDCGKGFVRKADLQSHTKVHTGEKPHTCLICKKTFAHAGSLVTHNLMHSGQKLFKCPICEKSFSQLSHLKIHQRTHSGERPHSCIFCEKSFASKSNLTVHIRTHTGETPYICPVCGKGFYDSSSMKKHKNIHSAIPSE